VGAPLLLPGAKAGSGLVWLGFAWLGWGPPTTTGDEAGGIGPGSGDTVSQLQRSAMETNDLGFVASLMFVLVPAVFLIILYIQTNSRQS
jgi:photosystem II PsbM protein